MTNLHVLLLIAAFLILTIGSFVWFIASWDAAAEEPIGLTTPAPKARLIT